MTKVLLLHGWDWHKYPVFKPEHQWQNRQELISELQKHYDVDYPSMPGFDQSDADRRGEWTLDDYAHWLQRKIEENRYDVVIGYSFGCAVATHWQYLFQNKLVSLVLISPAISRAYVQPQSNSLLSLSSGLKRVGLGNLVRFLRKPYLIYVVKNSNIIHGTSFLQKTYSNIVSIDLSGELTSLVDEGYPITCIFGSKDTATPPKVLFSRAPQVESLSFVIESGTHNIGATHPKEITTHINNFLKKKIKN